MNNANHNTVVCYETSLKTHLVDIQFTIFEYNSKLQTYQQSDKAAHTSSSSREHVSLISHFLITSYQYITLFWATCI